MRKGFVMYRNNVRAVILLLCGLWSVHSLHGMKVLTAWKNSSGRVKTGVVLTALGAVGVARDYCKRDEADIIDVSTPHNPITILSMDSLYKNGTSDGALYDYSATRAQLYHDSYLMDGLTGLMQTNRNENYYNCVNSILRSHFWVFDSVLRKRLTEFVMHISHQEDIQRKNNYISFVHGTHQGDSIMLRTIFDEVFNNNVHEGFVALRDDSVVQELTDYHNVYDYYDEKYPKAPREAIVRRTVGGPVLTGEQIVRFDRGDASKHLISTNLGFFGNSCLLRDGYKVSSAEFIMRSCSFTHKLFDGMIFIREGVYNPFLYGKFFFCLFKNPGLIADPNILFDKSLKDFDDSELMETIFKTHGVEEFYPQYRKELNGMRTTMSAGLVHLFVPEELAQRWCYVSHPLGIAASNNVESICCVENAHMQARILTHQEICMPHNTQMNFYLLGSQKKISTNIARMYAIAHEAKVQKELKQ